MKRLTIRSGFTGETYLTGEADVCWANRPIEERAFCTGCHRHKGKDRTNCGPLVLIDRLAAIEDILCDGTDDYDLDRLRVLCNQRMTMRDEMSERFSLTAKIPLDRLRELAEADREGRCVVLPCKVGDTAYKIGASICMWRETDHCDEYCNGYEYRDCWEGRRAVLEDKFSLDELPIFGKTVFLTREAAEAALKVREQE